MAANVTVLFIACLSDQNDSLPHFMWSCGPDCDIIVVQNFEFGKGSFLIMRFQGNPISVFAFVSFKDQSLLEQPADISLVDQKGVVFLDPGVQKHLLLDIYLAPHLIIQRISAVPS